MRPMNPALKRQLTEVEIEASEDAEDLAAAKRALADQKASGEEPRLFEEVVRELGL